MNTRIVIEDLRQRIQAEFPALLLQTYEEQRWEDEIAELAFELDRGLVCWSSISGAMPPLGADIESSNPVEFLKQIRDYPANHLFLLKDLHPYLNEPEVIRAMRECLMALSGQQKTLLLMSPVKEVPIELVKDLTVIELPLPGDTEIRDELLTVLAIQSEQVQRRFEPQQIDRMVQAVLGLTVGEARKAFLKAFLKFDVGTDQILPLLVAEKRHLIQGSNLLEFFDLEEDVADIGGLDGLKEWIEQRASAFTADAQARGISTPRGVLLAGVQGCGKSLSARAIAMTLGFPLVRLDVGSLLESARGSSEQNLRDVLKLMDHVAPAILWLEEIDKAFGGYDAESGSDATMSRIVGRFLTWLQEHTSPVFVVATANNISALPAELLRRGRFDEIFFVDLPNYQERCEIYRIHLQKRGWKPEKFAIEDLAEQSSGYSGAEIEQVVNSAIIESFAANRLMSQKDLDDARERTVPLSVTMEDEIFHLREWARSRCRSATTEFRVMEVMEEEERRGEIELPRGTAQPKWRELAEHGQIAAAVIEHVRLYDHVQWGKLISDFAPLVDLKGEYGLVLRADPKAVICVRISKELADIFCDYVDGRRLYLNPVALSETDVADRPTIEPIDTLPEERLTKPAWFPTKIRLLPPASGSGKLARVARIKMGR
ncbi:AAA family ATPase [Planctomicrobium sp. SH668]|uniref:AAA family ATPase n=1 Tax=Planctomicrobium sp. SH668 TaxID=3448126 RepID=UPI003F5B5E3E